MWPFAKKPPVETPVEPPCTKPLFSTEINALQGQHILEKTLDNLRFSSPRGMTNAYAMDGRTPDFPTPFDDCSTLDGLPDALTGWYAGQSFIGYQLAAILSQHWLIDKACTMPARDAVRQGFSIILKNLPEKLDSAAIVNAIEQRNLHFSLRAQMEEFVRMGRIFGIRLALFNVESSDPDYYVKPFNPDGVTKGSYQGISQIDPYWCTPELDNKAINDPSSANFYEPTYWLIGNRRIHHSHLVIFRNGEVPDILKPVYNYGGIPVPQKIMERVYAAERTANEAPQLAQSKRTMIWGTDLTTVLLNQKRFQEHMRVWTNYQNNFGIKLVNNDDVVQQFETSLADLDNVIATQYQIVAAAANVPATKLLGTTPKGFNATGEYEEASYHEELESIQTHDLQPLIDRHHMLLMASEIAPQFGLKNNTDIAIDWQALDSPTAKEYAEIGEILSRTDANLIATGAISAKDVAKRLSDDPTSGYGKLTGKTNNDQTTERY